MKSFNQLLSRTIFIIAALVFLAGQNAFAQEKEKEKEAKVVKIKISKQKGDEVIIDTIYMADLDNLEGLDLKEEVGKIIDIELDGLEDMETLKDIYISVGSDVDVDVDIDSDSDTDKEKNVMVWTTVSDEGSKKVIKLKCAEGGEDIVFISDGDAKLEVDKGYVFIMESEGDSKKFRIAMEKASGDESLIGVYKIDEDGDGDERTIIIHTLEYSSLKDEDKEVLNKAGIKLPESHLELKELFFFPNPNEGQFTLSFSTEKKGDLDVKVIDINGKVVHQETFNNFTGKYNKEIDITENSKGTYFLIIQHGKDVAAHKIIYQ